MQLTSGEKIIIAMLADLHKALKIEGEIDTDQLMAAIYNGHLWSLEWDYSGLLHANEASPVHVKETTDILDMWDFIEVAFEQLNDEGKARVKAENNNFEPVFRGFDGNNEEHFGIAKHLIERMGRFETFKGRALNSHSQVVPHYLRMLKVFEPIRNQISMRSNTSLTEDELIAVLKARQ